MTVSLRCGCAFFLEKLAIIKCRLSLPESVARQRGEKGIKIIAPVPIREKEEVEKFDPETNEPVLRPDGQPETEEVEHIIPRFRVATVFDISQTQGDPLPELDTPELMG